MFVPTSRHTGRHLEGGTPPKAVKRRIFPSLMPIPPAPRSPSPRMRSPSVTTLTQMSWRRYEGVILGWGGGGWGGCGWRLTWRREMAVGAKRYC